MAIYCTECGAPMDEDAGYCVNCGATAKAAPAPPVTPPSIRIPAPRRATNSLLKLVAVALLIFISVGALGIIGSIYVVHRITRSITTAARNHGVNLPSLPGPLN